MFSTRKKKAKMVATVKFILIRTFLGITEPARIDDGWKSMAECETHRINLSHELIELRGPDFILTAYCTEEAQT